MKVKLYAGQIGSGKGYVTSKETARLKETGNSIVLYSFANFLKKAVDGIFGCDKNLNPVPRICPKEQTLSGLVANIYVLFQEPQFKIAEDVIEIILKKSGMFMIYKEFWTADKERKKFIIRRWYQYFGTELGQSIKLTIWPELIAHKIQDLIDSKIDIDYIIIDDWRFLMEFFTLTTLLDIDVEPYVIIADREVRIKRRNVSIEKMKEMEEHLSEKEFNMIHEWVKLRYPDNIIVNNG